MGILPKRNRWLSRPWLAVLIGVGALATPAVAGKKFTVFYTGNMLLEGCQADDIGHRNACVGYVMAVTDVVDAIGSLHGWRACIPHSVTGNQVTDIALAYIEDAPEERHLVAHSLIARALADAFPCAE